MHCLQTLSSNMPVCMLHLSWILSAHLYEPCIFPRGIVHVYVCISVYCTCLCVHACTCVFMGASLCILHLYPEFCKQVCILYLPRALCTYVCTTCVLEFHIQVCAVSVHSYMCVLHLSIALCTVVYTVSI